MSTQDTHGVFPPLYASKRPPLKIPLKTTKEKGKETITTNATFLRDHQEIFFFYSVPHLTFTSSRAVLKMGDLGSTKQQELCLLWPDSIMLRNLDDSIF